MRKETINKIFAIMDNPKLSSQEKLVCVLKIFGKQKAVDRPFLRGVLLELGYEELANKI
jgi:hypothetical protein